MNKSWIVRLAKDRANKWNLLIKEEKDNRFKIYKLSYLPEKINIYKILGLAMSENLWTSKREESLLALLCKSSPDDTFTFTYQSKTKVYPCLIKSIFKGKKERDKTLKNDFNYFHNPLDIDSHSLPIEEVEEVAESEISSKGLIPM